jgi:hypothetical protein
LNQVNTYKRLIKISLSVLSQSVMPLMGGLLLFFSTPALSQICGASLPNPANPMPDNLGCVLAESMVVMLIFGLSLYYIRNLGGRWPSGAAIMWDHETDDFSDKPNIEVDSFTAAGMLSYSVLNWLSASGD